MTRREGRYFSTYGKEKWCRGKNPGHFAPTDTFRPLPGAVRRLVCDECWRVIVEARKVSKGITG